MDATHRLEANMKDADEAFESWMAEPITTVEDMEETILRQRYLYLAEWGAVTKTKFDHELALSALQAIK